MFSLIKVVDKILGLSAKELEIRQAINELRALSDKDLSDLGLSRCNIEHAVRHGRKGVDFNDYRAA
ncbi:MAG: DUF1127 domain-containing protein [Thiolinea sp.]